MLKIIRALKAFKGSTKSREDRFFEKKTLSNKKSKPEASLGMIWIGSTQVSSNDHYLQQGVVQVNIGGVLGEAFKVLFHHKKLNFKVEKNDPI